MHSITAYERDRMAHTKMIATMKMLMISPIPKIHDFAKKAPPRLLMLPDLNVPGETPCLHCVGQVIYTQHTGIIPVHLAQ